MCMSHGIVNSDSSQSTARSFSGQFSPEAHLNILNELLIIGLNIFFNRSYQQSVYTHRTVTY